jgi:putative FmdB family regulatory protein
MPIYVYKCQKCDRVIEEIQKFSDDPLKTCDEVALEDECPGGGIIERQMTVPSKPHLKGAGWAGDGYAKPAPAEKAAPADDTDFSKVAAKTRDILVKQAARDFDGAGSK